MATLKIDKTFQKHVKHFVPNFTAAQLKEATEKDRTLDYVWYRSDGSALATDKHIAIYWEGAWDSDGQDHFRHIKTGKELDERPSWTSLASMFDKQGLQTAEVGMSFASDHAGPLEVIAKHTDNSAVELFLTDKLFTLTVEEPKPEGGSLAGLGVPFLSYHGKTKDCHAYRDSEIRDLLAAPGRLSLALKAVQAKGAERFQIHWTGRVSPFQLSAPGVAVLVSPVRKY